MRMSDVYYEDSWGGCRRVSIDVDGRPLEPGLKVCTRSSPHPHVQMALVRAGIGDPDQASEAQRLAVKNWPTRHVFLEALDGAYEDGPRWAVFAVDSMTRQVLMRKRGPTRAEAMLALIDALREASAHWR